MNKNDFVATDTTFKELFESYSELLSNYKKYSERYAEYYKECMKNDNPMVGDDTIVDEYYTRGTREWSKILRLVLGQISSTSDKNFHILLYNITFEKFDGDISSSCNGFHYFINTGSELKCLLCGRSTKEYNLTKEEFDMLREAAKLQNRLLKNVTEKDKALLKLLLYKYSKATPNYEGLSETDIWEEESLCDESEVRSLSKKIRIAHERDTSIDYSGYYKGSAREKFISKEEAEERVLTLSSELKQLEKSDTNSRFKNLMIEEYRTAIYEILILSGRSIPYLLNQAKTEDKKIALIKAYYNLSNPKFRANSDYFIDDALTAREFICTTANEEINKKILELSLKR